MADEPLPSDPGSEHRPSDGSGHDAPLDPPYADPAATESASEIDQPARYIQPATHGAEPISEEEEEGGPVKSFLEHLEDLRWVLIKIIASILVSMTICMVAAPYIVDLLKWPKEQTEIGKKVELVWLHPLGAFTTMMKIGFWGGLVLAIPYILFVVGQFVMPALKKNEKPYFRKAFVIGGGLFFIGALMCYGFVLPIAIGGMVQIADWMHIPTHQWTADEYFQFSIMFMLGMGLSFEIPVILLTLVKMGIIPHDWMAKGRMYFFIANMVICAFITPDAVSTIFMVIPVQLLLEICIQISAHWERQKRREEARRLEEEKRR
jgi:sec-independent protein translocase protein TatC